MKENYILLPIEGEQIPSKTKLGKLHIKGMHRLAQVILPAASDLPSFEKVEPEQYVNGMIDYMYSDDRAAILILLNLFAFTPRFVIRGIMHTIEGGAKWKGSAGALFRMLQIALKGLIFTLYYSDFTEGKIIHKALAYDAKIVR